jgi:BlaI family transcriptional regulator, penicillinase repressor
VKEKLPENLSRRERQIMDIIYQTGEATAAEIQEKIANPPSYSSVRALLRILEEKGHLKHKKDGARYVYMPKITRDKARNSALKHIMKTFFNNSAEDVVATLMEISSSNLSDQDFERLENKIEEMRKEGK